MLAKRCTVEANFGSRGSPELLSRMMMASGKPWGLMTRASMQALIRFLSHSKMYRELSAEVNHTSKAWALEKAVKLPPDRSAIQVMLLRISHSSFEWLRASHQITCQFAATRVVDAPIGEIPIQADGQAGEIGDASTGIAPTTGSQSMEEDALFPAHGATLNDWWLLSPEALAASSPLANGNAWCEGISIAKTHFNSFDVRTVNTGA
mmetsp:Transcript_113049/g.324910  ORF Transcript_113049/g.324910 Transcript_113049/m.324910 type:complete len:207 (+) Transcript_113049:465-1085(+)